MKNLYKIQEKPSKVNSIELLNEINQAFNGVNISVQTDEIFIHTDTNLKKADLDQIKAIILAHNPEYSDLEKAVIDDLDFKELFTVKTFKAFKTKLLELEDRIAILEGNP